MKVWFYTEIEFGKFNSPFTSQCNLRTSVLCKGENIQKGGVKYDTPTN